MPAKGAAAQAETARRKAEKRAAKVRANVHGEDKDFRDPLDNLLRGLAVDLQEIMREVVSNRMKKIKDEKAQLRETAQEAESVAEARKSELDGQVVRARGAEKEVQALRGEVKDVKVAVKDEMTSLQEVIEEQASTIKAQARALREAEKKAKG